MLVDFFSQWKRQWNLLLLAGSFFSRLPVAQYTRYTDANMHAASRYFSLVGWIIGSLLLLVYEFFDLVTTTEIAVLAVIIASMLLTGALHEDGLADSADAFGGGFDKGAKLIIMKDSRLGTYGVCALLAACASKFWLLLALARAEQLTVALAIAYPLSRAMAFSHVQHLPYASLPGSSKSSPLAKPLDNRGVWVLFGIGGIGLLVLDPLPLLAIVSTCMLARAQLKKWMFRHIQGFTGDTLGAAQQVQEILIYTVLVATLRYL